MRLLNLKKTIAVSALGLATLLGVSDVANAQPRRTDKQEKRVEKQREKAERERRKLEAERARLAQQREFERQRAWNQQNRNNNRWRIYRDGRYYNTDNRGVELLRQAVNQGYQQGFRAGQYDNSNRRQNNYYGNSIYRSGNYGYQSFVDSAQYRYYFQQGFQRGYQDGYNRRYQYGTYNNGIANILGSVLLSIFNPQQY